MSDPFANQTFPRSALLGAGALVGITIFACALSSLGHHTDAQRPASAIVAMRDLRFADRPDGAVIVYSIDQHAPPVTLNPGTNGFVRGVLRGMARDRRSRDLGMDVPFRLTRWSGGYLTLEDVATGRIIELRAFGSTNEQAFARLLAVPAVNAVSVAGSP